MLPAFLWDGEGFLSAREKGSCLRRGQGQGRRRVLICDRDRDRDGEGFLSATGTGTGTGTGSGTGTGTGTGTVSDGVRLNFKIVSQEKWDRPRQRRLGPDKIVYPLPRPTPRPASSPAPRPLVYIKKAAS